jgi:Protein of unknown function (DUF3435)
LTDEYDLDVSNEYKPTPGIEDMLAILHYHRRLDIASVPHERYTLQLLLLMLMTAFTASRPGALIESGCEALCCKDVVLRVLPNPSEPSRHVLAMEVSLFFMKGKRNKSQP